MKQLKYYLLWKGSESGPFSFEEVERKLKFGEIGLLHKIRCEVDEEFSLLKDYDFSSRLVNSRECKWASSVSTEYVLYVFAGLSFLSKWIMLVSVMLSIVIWILNNRSLAKKSFITSLTMGGIGFVFFEIIYPVLIQ